MPCLRRALLIALGVLTILPAAALAGSPVTTDCYRHTMLTRHYTVAQLRAALATMPADVKEYTSCYTVIEDQLFHQLGKPVPGSGDQSGGGSSGSSGGSFISTPLLVALIVIVVGGAGFTYAAWRRGRGAAP